MLAPRSAWSALMENPLLRLEMRALQRARWQRVTMRLTWALLALMVVAAAILSLRYWNRLSDLIWIFFALLTLIMLGRALLGGVTAITREQEQQSWEGLLLSQLTPLEILIGKGVPVLATALMPALVGAPLLLLMTQESWLGPLMALCCLFAAAAAVALWAMRVAVLVPRTADALVRACLPPLIAVPLLLPLLERWLVRVPPPQSDWFLHILLPATLFCAGVLAAAVALLSSAAGHLAADDRYTPLTRGASAACLLCGVLLCATEWRAQCLIALLIPLTALACAGAPPPPPADQRRRSLFHPWETHCGGVFGAWVSLHAVALPFLPVACAFYDPLHYEFVVRPTVFVLYGHWWGYLLFLAGLGCFLAARLSRLSRSFRRAVVLAAAIAIPLLLTGFPGSDSNATAIHWGYLGFLERDGFAGLDTPLDLLCVPPLLAMVLILSPVPTGSLFALYSLGIALLVAAFYPRRRREPEAATPPADERALTR